MDENEIVQSVRLITFDMECPQCKRGRMRYTGMSSVAQDGQVFLHVCSACSYQNTYTKIYPSNVKIGEGEICHILEI